MTSILLDIISKGVILMGTTLTDRISRNFPEINLKKASVKAPKLKVRSDKALKQKKEDRTTISSIVNILIKSAVEKAGREKKEKHTFEEDEGYAILKEDLKEDKSMNFGGYGASSKGYGSTPGASYADYNKLFSYLGKFRAKSAYEGMDNAEKTGMMPDSGKFSLVDSETMDKGVRHVRYFTPGNELNILSLVPIAGMNSGEWEQFKLWMKLDPVMYRLKTSTS